MVRRLTALFVILNSPASGTAVHPDVIVVSAPAGSNLLSKQVESSFSFEVAAIRKTRSGEYPALIWRSDGLSIHNLPLLSVLMLAYGPEEWIVARWSEPMINNAPEWVRSETYDIEAKVAPNDVLRWSGQRINGDLRHQALKHLLEERCDLRVHPTLVTVEAYALRKAKISKQLIPYTEGSVIPSKVVTLSKGGYLEPVTNNEHPEARFYATTMVELANFLSESSDREVLDDTGLVGRYNFSLWRNEVPEGDQRLPDSPWDLRKAGITLKPTKAQAEGVFVEQINRPSAN